MEKRFLVQLTCVFLSHIEITAGLENVAYRKSVEMVSFHGNATKGHFAVDGVRSRLLKDGCAMTGKSENPWIMVDLGTEFIISAMIVITKASEVLNDLYIGVGGTKTSIAEVLFYNNTIEDNLTTTFPDALCGQFVKLWLEGKTKLNICELEVYGENDASFTVWSSWTSCTQSCGSGTRIRTRVCTTNKCCGSTTETGQCYTQDCIETCVSEPHDCQDINGMNVTESGVYHVIPIGTYTGLDVYCDMDGDTGWTVIQRRMNALTDFNRRWTDYLKFFGDLEGSFWLGLRPIHMLVFQGHYELRVELEDWDGTIRYAHYDYLYIGDSRDGYKLTVDGYSGNAGDGMSRSNGFPFGTWDKESTSENCSALLQGAWWYEACGDSNLNGIYRDTATAGVGIAWVPWKGTHYSLKKTVMKIKRV